MNTSYKIAMISLMAITVVLAIIDIRNEMYKDAFYMGVQLLWLAVTYSLISAVGRAEKHRQMWYDAYNIADNKLAESEKREQLAQNLIAQLRKRIRNYEQRDN